MTNSTITRLYKYVSIFGKVWWLSIDEAEAKLEHEQQLFEKWWRDFPDMMQAPRIER